MIYVYPHCKKYENEISKIDGISRLFAYPTIPTFTNNAQITILDSGAFYLFKSHKTMDKSYMDKLSTHYYRYANDNTICVAPDVAGNTAKSVINFKRWIDAGKYKYISPVLHISKNNLDINSLFWQIDIYAKYSYSNKILFATPIDAITAKGLGIGKAFDYCKSKGFNWVHVLGAGWSLKDISIWRTIGNIDSIDSIAYYNTYDINAFGSLNPIENIKNIEEFLKNE